MQKAKQGIVRCGSVIGLALTFLLCPVNGAGLRTAAADIATELKRPQAQLAPGNFDLRASGLDLKKGAVPAPVLQRFVREVSAGQPAGGDDRFAVLTPADAALYRQAFAALTAGDDQAALAAARLTQDKLLLGHVQATSLLAKGKDASYPELAAWLASYSDLPQAARMHALAQQRRPKGTKALPAPAAIALTRGNLDSNGRGLTAQIRLTDGETKGTALALAQKINLRLRDGGLDEVAAALRQARSKDEFPRSWLAEGNAALAAARFFNGENNPLRDLSAPDFTGAPLAGWIGGLQAWRDNHPDRAARLFGYVTARSDLPAADQAAAWFWQGRALEKLGRAAEARAAWRKAAACSRCFYGQLAQARLGITPAISWNQPALGKDGIAAIAAHPAGKRALALLQIDAPELAAAELRRVPVQGHPVRAAAILALAQQAKMPALAMQLASFLKSSDGKPLASALYPLPDWPAQTGGDRALVFAVMRQESAFDPQAVSASGARGLMQIMPQTARFLTSNPAPDLFNPAENLALGSRYLQHLAAQPEITNNLLHILAAYNGGPGNLLRWRNGIAHDNDPLLFIESLPLRETRHYVQYVLSNYWMYQSRLGVKQTSLQQIAGGNWPLFKPDTAYERTAASSRPENGLLQMASK